MRIRGAVPIREPKIGAEIASRSRVAKRREIQIGEGGRTKARAPARAARRQADGPRGLLVRPQARSPNAKDLLSPRELEIARLVAVGHPNKVIADVLEISSWTVGTHLRRIFAKLNVPSRAAMVARLLGEGGMGEPPGGTPRPSLRGG